jgi:hypothetical protein
MASSTATATLGITRFLEAEASLPRRRSRPVKLQGGDEITLLPTASETPRTGARGASYADAVPGVEHLLAQEPTLLLLLAAAATGGVVFLDETGTGGGEPERHFLAALAPTRTASSGAS